MATRKRICSVLMSFLLWSPAVWADELADPYAGYRVDVEDADAWTSQLTNEPGVTSRLCIARNAPRLILCFQGLHQPLKDGVMQLARGFADGITETLGVSNPGKFATARFAQLSGFSMQFTLPPSAELEDVWLFAGTGPAGQVQTVLAFSAAEERERAQAVLQDVVNAVRYDAVTDDEHI